MRSQSIDHQSPLKRRKTEGTATLSSSFDAQLANFRMDPPVTWPAKGVPVEIFNEIMRVLPRSSILNMRLVNKEFESKVLAYLFRVVVVPFKPEIYGIASTPALDGSVQSGDGSMKDTVMLQDKGMRVFSGFGRHIHKFALSFEFEENKLANPPLKSEQEAITSFWGIYRWPYQRYNRFHHLEGLEQTADETTSMATALRHLTQVKQLGLSIDGCLGWISGPDINRRVAARGEKPVVFGKPSFIPEDHPQPSTISSHNLGDITISQNAYAILEQMLQEAGYHDERLEQSLRVLMETEETASHEAPAQEDSTTMASTRQAHHHRRTLFQQAAQLVAANQPQPAGTIVSNNIGSAPEESDPDTDTQEENDLPTLFSRPSDIPKDKALTYALKPNDLSNAQKEMLLEIEWAQRAFMQSYVLAVMDSPTTFANIQTLNIARLPHRHLAMLGRSEFWNSLPALANLSLAVIPDWREVSKLPTSWIEDILLLPSQSVPGVYDLLDKHISPRENITQFHFEWICGGEYSPGLFSRDKLILPAPIVPKAMDMVTRLLVHPILHLPHVKHLSMKNCWFSPHMMSRFTHGLRKDGCERLSFDSVSLTANIAPNAQPGPQFAHLPAPPPPPQPQVHALHMHNHQLHIQNQNALTGPFNFVNQNQYFQFQQAVFGQHAFIGLAPHHNLHVPPPPAPVSALPAPANPNVMPDWMDVPRVGSWAAIIDQLTPLNTLADLRCARGFGPVQLPQTRYPLHQLNFESCGYVRVPLSFDQSDVEWLDQSPGAAIAKRISDLDSVMLKTRDPSLATIAHHISPTEEATLENAFGMDVGWFMASSKVQLLQDCQDDGIVHAGRGRFCGTLQRYPPPEDMETT